jgi:carboxyl-terminal processing protease
MNRRILFIWILPLLMLSVYAGLVIARNRTEAERAVYWEDDLFQAVREAVGDRYVDALTEEQTRELFHRSIRAYLSGLDRYCIFYTPEELEGLQADTKGEFGGIGVYLKMQDDGLLIRAVRKGYPAHDAGVRPGDLFVAIEGRKTSEIPQQELTGMLKGPVETKVVVSVKTGDAEPRDVTLTRAIIRVDSVLGARLVDAEKKIGYIRVDSFKENTVDDFQRELLKLRDELGATSVILDLRNNGGGVLPTATEIVDCFLRRGDIVITRGRLESSVRVFEAHEKGTIFPDQPMIVLVNGDSASASEVVAGALQDHRRAVLVGERTWGKFLVQSIIDLSWGGDTRAAIRMTTAKYLTPFGRCLQRDDDRGVRGGLLPEVVLPLTEEAHRALTVHWNAEMTPGWIRMPGDQLVAPPDIQLDAAIDLLRGSAVLERLTGGAPKKPEGDR